MNLDEYVAKHGENRGGLKCAVCLLPIELRQTVDAGKGRFSARTIAEWLTTDRKKPVKKGTVERHLREHTR